jgi:hypothetical protein
MRTVFVCLANSKKYGERCIAGVKLQGGRDGYSVRIEDNKPKWIRPVSNSEHGEVEEKLIKSIHLLDIIEIDVTRECPKGYQSENVEFDRNSLKVLSRIQLSAENLDMLTDKISTTIFGNRGKAVHIDDIPLQTNSLCFIKAEDVRCYYRTDYGKKQLRAKFRFGNIEYDLPITDVNFIEDFGNNNNLLDSVKDIYLTLSLGVKYREFHYKLIAGVIYL